MPQFKWVLKLIPSFNIYILVVLYLIQILWKAPMIWRQVSLGYISIGDRNFQMHQCHNLNEFQSFFHLLIYLWVLFYLMEILRKAPIIWRQASLGYISIGDRDRRSMWGWDIKLQTLHLVGGPIPTRNRIGEFIWNKHLYYVLWSIVQVGNTYILCLHRNIT